jgi:VWFA-related protein
MIKRLVARPLYALLLAWVGLLLWVPNAFAQSPPAPPPEGIILQLPVNTLLIPVVVRDSQGHAVGNLKQKDFKVFDQGKPRPIAGFTLQGSAPILDGEQAAASSSVSGGSTSSASSKPAFPAIQSIVFLFDDRHLGPAEVEQVKTAGVRLLDQPLPDGERALVLSFTGVNSGLTHAHAPLQAAIMKLKANQVYRPSAHQCPDIDYYSADQILNKHSKSEWDIAYERAANCSHQSSAMASAAASQGGADDVSQLVRTAATLALETGDEDIRATMDYVRDVIHTMSQFPGQRTLILISPGFYSGTEEGLFLQSQILELAASSHVVISALDARGLYSGMMTASQSTDGSVYANIIGQPVQDRLQSMRENQDILAELADGTGGTFFHNNNDLEKGLKTLSAGPAYLYLLELSLQNVKQNGAYHSLKVEVDQNGLKLQCRRGYFAPRPPRKK